MLGTYVKCCVPWLLLMMLRLLLLLLDGNLKLKLNLLSSKLLYLQYGSQLFDSDEIVELRIEFAKFFKKVFRSIQLFSVSVQFYFLEKKIAERK